MKETERALNPDQEASSFHVTPPHLFSSYMFAPGYPIGGRLYGPFVRVRIINSTILPIDAFRSNFFSLVTASVYATPAAVAAAILTAQRVRVWDGWRRRRRDWYGWFPPAIAPPDSPPSWCHGIRYCPYSDRVPVGVPSSVTPSAGCFRFLTVSSVRTLFLELWSDPPLICVKMLGSTLELCLSLRLLVPRPHLIRVACWSGG